MTLLMVVGLGVLSAYLYMGRNLTRLVNMQQQDVKARRTLETFAQDVGAATTFVTATDSQFEFYLQSAAGTGDRVNYTYTTGASATGRLVRTYMPAAGAAEVITLLTNLSVFDFNYFNEPGIATTSLSYIKSAQFSFTSQVGTAASGTQASYSSVSSRIVARNKPTLQ
jgi:hypothetical protein